MLYDFSRDYNNHSEKIRDHLEMFQTEEAKRCAHSLKGVTRTLGIIRLAKITAEVEDAIKTENIFRFKQLYPSLKNELSRVCNTVAELEIREKAEENREKLPNEAINEELIYELDELGEFVRSGNYRAERIASQMKERYSDNQLSEVFEELFLAVEDLDAQRALKCINYIKKTIEGEK